MRLEFCARGHFKALGKEVASFGVEATTSAPGQSRTDRAGLSMDRTPWSIADYDTVMDPIRAARQAKSGNQQGDLASAAQALLSLVETQNPLTRLFLGEDARELVGEKFIARTGELTTSDALSRSTSFALFHCKNAF
jgi:hypothetical protein